MNTPSLHEQPRAALITGGAKRIGRAIALALARQGYAVAIGFNGSQPEAQSLAREITALGVGAAAVHANLSTSNDSEDIVARAASAIGPLTLLVNNASLFEIDEFGTLDAALWDRHFAVNLRAPVFLAQAFAQQTPAGANASIVNITDQRVERPAPRQFSYTLSKCGLDAATTLLAQALAPRIRVNAVAPGPTLPSPRQDDATFARQAAALPLEHGPQPEQIADAVVYLAGAASVTGQTIAVDGGQHIAWKTPDVWGIEQ
jgi:NAD(P)-dependent dehydrogenase (short-subunit alcohol dehydrogenase family)